jgi:hypothetical protein
MEAPSWQVYNHPPQAKNREDSSLHKRRGSNSLSRYAQPSTRNSIKIADSSTVEVKKLVSKALKSDRVLSQSRGQRLPPSNFRSDLKGLVAIGRSESINKRRDINHSYDGRAPKSVKNMNLLNKENRGVVLPRPLGA